MVAAGVAGADLAFEDFSACPVGLGLKLELFTSLFKTGLEADNCTTSFGKLWG